MSFNNRTGTVMKTPTTLTSNRRELRAERAEARNTAAVTIAEFGAEFGPCRAATYNLIRKGELSAKKIGRSTIITRDEAERWFSALPAFESAAA